MIHRTQANVNHIPAIGGVISVEARRIDEVTRVQNEELYEH